MSVGSGTAVTPKRYVPGEWEAHSHTIVSWPTREIVWEPLFARARDEYVHIIEQISRHEQVLVICRPQDESAVAAVVPKSADILTHPIDDGWIRDNGPLAVRVDGLLVAVDFEFNSWGGRFAPWAGDSTVGEAIANHFNVRREAVPFILEGGAISFNGDDTAVVVEECVLNTNRNGEAPKAKFEALVRTQLGVERVIWLPFGLLEDLNNTDGHVDNVAVFVGENRILVQVADEGNANFARLNRNLEVLESSYAASGAEIHVETLQSLPYADVPDGHRQAAPYLNFAITNGSLLIPSAGDARTDEAAAEQIGSYFPGRVATMVSSYALTHGGGGPHCITMQWPRL